MNTQKCRRCDNPAKKVCNVCYTSVYCSPKCFVDDKQHYIRCSSNIKNLPPFPIPKNIAFLIFQTSQHIEYNLYGTQYVINVMESQNLNTKDFKGVLNEQLNVRKTLIFEMLNTIAKDTINVSWYIIYGQFEYFIQSPTYDIKEILETLYVTTNDMDDMFVQFKKIINVLYKLDDFVLNCYHLGTVVHNMFDNQQDFHKEWTKSNKQISQAKNVVYVNMRDNWRKLQPSFDVIFPKATLYSTKQLVRTIKDDMILYRGQPTETKEGRPIQRPGIPKRNSAWFAIDPWTAITYILPTYGFFSQFSDYNATIGEISAFVVDKDLQLLDMSVPYNVHQMHELIVKSKDDELLSIFESIWNFTDEGTIVRKSIQKLDILWVNWLCKYGYDGYIANSDVGLHAEIFFCNWQKHCRYLGTYNTKEILQVPFMETYGIAYSVWNALK